MLDNCEHLVDAVARLTDALLEGCPNLCVLATSREPLGITGEVSWGVPPLAMPHLWHAPSVEELGSYESVRLFVERARHIERAFALAPHNAQYVSQICQRLEGMPLAIELVAARAKVLSALLYRQGDYDRAVVLLKKSLTVLRGSWEKWYISRSVECLATVVSMQGYSYRAARLFGAGEALREAIGASQVPFYLVDHARGVATARAGLGEEDFAAAWAEGRAMTVEQAVEYMPCPQNKRPPLKPFLRRKDQPQTSPRISLPTVRGR